MPAIESLLPFLVATAVFAYIPGPSMLYAATQTLVRGRHAGWMAALGIHLGGYVHVLAAAAGLSTIFSAVPSFYVGVKLLGSAYLVWLGVRLFMSSETNTGDAVVISDRSNSAAGGRVLRQSAIVEILNPKTALFYLAFLPQFTDMAAAFPIWAQLLLLGAFVNIAFSSADVLCVAMSSRVVRFLTESAAFNRFGERAGGIILTGLGVHLGLSHP